MSKYLFSAFFILVIISPVQAQKEKKGESDIFKDFIKEADSDSIRKKLKSLKPKLPALSDTSKTKPGFNLGQDRYNMPMAVPPGDIKYSIPVTTPDPNIKYNMPTYSDNNSSSVRVNPDKSAIEDLFKKNLKPKKDSKKEK